MPRCRRTARQAEAGLSLLELLIVVSLLGLFMGAVYESVIVGLRVANASNDREDIRLQLAKTLDQFTREASLASNVRTADSDEFKFDADVDGDGTTETNIRYRVQNGRLERSVGGTTVTLITNLTTLSFTYLDLNNNSWTSGTEADVRVVETSMTATKNNETLSLAHAAYLRNM